MDEIPPLERLRRQLKQDEGLRLKPYLDCCGKSWRQCQCQNKGQLTIGYGRNLDARGISVSEAEVLLDRDIQDTLADLRTFLPWLDRLDVVRQAVLINMAFNLGTAGLLKFRQMLLAVQRGDWEAAAREMESSRWWSQVGRRAVRLREQMRTGRWA